MTVKPLFNHGVDVTDIPGIAGWLVSLIQMFAVQSEKITFIDLLLLLPVSDALYFLCLG